MLASRQRHTGSLSRHVQVIITFVLRKLLQNIAHIVNSGWTHWRLHPQNQTKMRMGDLFLIHPDSNSLLRRSWTNECHSIKNLQISFRSRWTGPTWWTVETRWSFSLGKLCPVSSVRRWTQDVSFKVVFVSTRFLPQMFGVSQPSYIDENLTDLPELDNEDSERLRSFVVSVLISLEVLFNPITPFRQAWIFERVTLCQWGLSEMTPSLEHYSPGALERGISCIDCAQL